MRAATSVESCIGCCSAYGMFYHQQDSDCKEPCETWHNDVVLDGENLC